MKLLTVLTLLACCCFCSTATAQKVKLKDDLVLVDKEPRYRLEEVTARPTLGTYRLSDYRLTDMDGKTLYSFTDTNFYFLQLPHEEEPRAAYGGIHFKSKPYGLDTIVDRTRSIGYRKALVRLLERSGFFADPASSDHATVLLKNWYSPNITVKEVYRDSINRDRAENARYVATKYGPQVVRTPGVGGVKVSGGTIRDNGTPVGTIKLDKRGSYADIYQLMNLNGTVVATAALIHSENRMNFRIVGDQEQSKRYWIPITRDSFGNPADAEEKLNQLTKAVVEAGIL